MTHITKYLHFPKKKITHIKRDCPKSHFISKNSSITSCHLLLSLPEGNNNFIYIFIIKDKRVY